MTEQERLGLLHLIHSRPALAGAGLLVIEGFASRVLRRPAATGFGIFVALYQLDAMNRNWSASAWNQDVHLHLARVGVHCIELAPAGVFHDCAGFVGVVAGRGTDSSGTDAQAALLQATQQMQETQMSFNLQYLQLQSQMQSENRSYTAVSHIMKTKHDTVKNSISNVR